MYLLTTGTQTHDRYTPLTSKKDSGEAGQTDVPVVALSVQQRLGVAVQGRDGVAGVKALLGVIQRHEERRLLDGVQGLLVLPPAEVCVAGVGPWGPGGR